MIELLLNPATDVIPLTVSASITAIDAALTRSKTVTPETVNEDILVAAALNVVNTVAPALTTPNVLKPLTFIVVNDVPGEDKLIAAASGKFFLK